MTIKRITGTDATFTIRDAEGIITRVGKITGWSNSIAGELRPRGSLLKWSEEHGPGPDCPYNHVIAETPFGRVVIDWKGWKDRPSYEAEAWDEHVHGDSLEEAKARVQLIFDRKLEASGIPGLAPAPVPVPGSTCDHDYQPIGPGWARHLGGGPTKCCRKCGGLSS